MVAPQAQTQNGHIKKGVRLPKQKLHVGKAREGTAHAASRDAVVAPQAQVGALGSVPEGGDSQIVVKVFARRSQAAIYLRLDGCEIFYWNCGFL